MTRRRELLVGATAVGIAVVFAAAVFVWRVVFDDAWWSPPELPRMEGLAAFDLYLWIIPICVTILGVLVLVAAIRRRFRWIGAALPIVLGIAVFLFYVPLWFVRHSHADRLRGVVEEPFTALRALVIVIAATFVLSWMFGAVTRMRRTPQGARTAAFVTTTMLYAGALPFVWLFVVTPVRVEWFPTDWERSDLLVAVRPCRGAQLWQRAYPFATIDDVWLRFADRRDGGRPEWAISATSWRTYYWLDAQDVRALRVRIDDPAVIDCDSRARPEPVTSAPSHYLGADDY